jgi:hypothetical protein
VLAAGCSRGPSDAQRGDGGGAVTAAVQQANAAAARAADLSDLASFADARRSFE